MIKRLRHLFCRHHEATWKVESQRFFVGEVCKPIIFNLSGEHQYLICDRCGKKLGTRCHSIMPQLNLVREYESRMRVVIGWLMVEHIP